jgi:hypothetical protein
VRGASNSVGAEFTWAMGNGLCDANLGINKPDQADAQRGFGQSCRIVISDASKY